MELAERLMPGFAFGRTTVGDVTLRHACAGTGPPVLLLHGHPQTLVAWRHVAPRLVAAGFTVVAADLRGYGGSSKPPGGRDHAAYSKRAMAADMVALMRTLGHDRFAVAGHDRGGRVAHRMALDHPGAVDRLAVVDIAPTATMYARTDKTFATRYFWWFFLIQPFDLPERMIGSDPEHFLRHHLAGQGLTEDRLEPEAFAEYLHWYRRPETLHAICEDYRAAAGIDLAHDAADEHRKVDAPLLAVWGAEGFVGQAYDVPATWAEKAQEVTGRALPCGHAVPELAPAALADALTGFLGP